MKSQFRRNFAKLLAAAMVVSQIAIPGSAVYADAADTTRCVMGKCSNIYIFR